MKFSIAVAAVLTLLVSSSAFAQGTGCTPTSTPQAVTQGRTNITFQSADHTAVDPAGAPKVTDYFGEIRVKGQSALVTNFTIPKASVAPLTGSGIPAGCLSTALPAMSGLLPTATYTLTFYARNTAVSPSLSLNALSADFFLESGRVPSSPALLSFVTN